MHLSDLVTAARDLLRGWIGNFVPFLGWIGELLDPRTLRADIVAGITVALILIPQSMAYAQLAGLPPQYGLYASFLPGIIAAIFGSSRQLATGPVAVVSLLTAVALGEVARFDPAAYVTYAIAIALIVGIFQLALGMLRLGFLVSFISHPVIIGFTNAAAIIIATSQIGKLFGVSVEPSEHQYETVYNTIIAAIEGTNFVSLALGVLAIALIMGARRISPRIPGVLLAVVSTTVISWMINYAETGGKVVGTIPAVLPEFGLPELELARVLEFVPIAMTIALIGFMEAISIAKAMATQTRQQLDPDQELIGQGLANLASSFCQGYAVSGSFSRSAVNFSAGAVTGFSAVVTGLIVMVTLLFLTPLLFHLPQAALAGAVIAAVFNLVDIKPFIHAWKVHLDDGLVAITTFVLTLILAPHLEYGIVAGIIMSLVLYLYRSMRPRVIFLSRHMDGTLRDAELFDLELCPNISVVRFDGSLYFANTGLFEDMMIEKVATRPNLQFVILDAEGINEIDASGMETLHAVEQRLALAGVELVIARAKRQLRQPLQRAGFVEHIGEERIFRIRNQAIMYAWSKIEKCDKEGCTQTCPLRAHLPGSDPAS